MATIKASENEFPEVLFAEGAAPSTPGTGLVKAYAKSDGLLYAKDDAGVESALGVGAHLADTTDAHDGSAVSVDPTGLSVVTGTDVQTAIEELDAGIGAGGIPVTIIDAAGDLIVGTAADTAARLAKGSNGESLRTLAGSVLWAPTTKFGTPKVRTAGSHTCNSTTWVELAAATGGPGTGTYDFDFTGCAAGDILEVAISGGWGSEATNGCLTWVTIVSASPVTYIMGAPTTTTGDGILGLYGFAGTFQGVAATAYYVLQSGDLSAGALKVRPYYRTTSATNKTFYGTTGDTAHFMAKVHRA